MFFTTPDGLAAIEFQLDWVSEHASHTDKYYAPRVNFWRDAFPDNVYEQLKFKSVGEQIEFEFDAGEIVPVTDNRKAFSIKSGQFQRHYRNGADIAPRSGRYYPKGILKDIAGVFKANVEPFRMAEVNPSTLTVDFNHPLGGRRLKLTAAIQEVWAKTKERGGECIDWLDTITQGPGMQSRWSGRPTDFFSDRPFSREDESADGVFYEKPRFVNHLDDTAIRNITEIYRGFVKPGFKVLDLMSSWTSHLPEDVEFARVTGLGMNREELAANPRLTDHRVHDLNREPALPFTDRSYDLVVCTASIEYLNQPFTIFEEVYRVLKPGGIFVVTFSNRWFPPKAIKIWTEIHEFERMGLVTEYFLQSGKFDNLSTYSIRGLPRSETDKYYPENLYSDPVYAVWGSANPA